MSKQESTSKEKKRNLPAGVRESLFMSAGVAMGQLYDSVSILGLPEIVNLIAMVTLASIIIDFIDGLVESAKDTIEE